MANLFILYTTLTVFGVGVTIIDFLGILDQPDDGGSGDLGDSGDADSSGDADVSGDGESGVLTHHGSILAHEGEQARLARRNHAREKPGIRIIGKIMNFLRTLVYFSLGFGPTGLFASFTSLPRTKGFIWACGVGVAMTILARLLRRFIRRDLDSSIKPDELLQEKGVLLLPLDGETISKAVVRSFGREMEIYVRCADKSIKLPKGKEITIVDFDNDIYWVEPAEQN